MCNSYFVSNADQFIFPIEYLFKMLSYFYVAGMDCDLEKDLSLEKIATGRNKQQQKKCCRVMTSPARSARQPDSPYAYLVCFCGVLCNFIVCGCSYSYGLLFPSLLDEFKEGKAKTGNSDSFSGVRTSCKKKAAQPSEHLAFYFLRSAGDLFSNQ